MHVMYSCINCLIASHVKWHMQIASQCHMTIVACMQDFQKQIDALESQKDRLQDEVASLQAACNEHVQMNSQLGQRISVRSWLCTFSTTWRSPSPLNTAARWSTRYTILHAAHIPIFLQT